MTQLSRCLEDINHKYDQIFEIKPKLIDRSQCLRVLTVLYMCLISREI